MYALMGMIPMNSKVILGWKKILQNNTADTAPDAPTELYQTLSLCLYSVVSDDMTMPVR